ncbi:MAG: hypothetical protein LC793_20260, partial [Thermomicrobia bacterium]|nr:hypothetical protein [Thermomicrobia bacterium]
MSRKTWRATAAPGRFKEGEPDRTPPASAIDSGADRRPRLWTMSVFFFAAAFFLLLMSGHLYAHDEETLYQMTDGIVVHGAPLVSPDAWGIVGSSAPSKNGRRPTSYAPGQPFLAVPWYLAGRAVGALSGQLSANYLSRFVVLTFNGFVTAATVALLFRLTLAFGYRARVGAALVVCFGAATYALIQARTFFAEPLTAFLALLALFLMREACAEYATPRRRQMLLASSGFAIAAALFVKIHAALFLPALALFLTLAAFPSFRALRVWSRWRSLLLNGLWWISGFLIPVAGLLLYNRWLYGSPLTTGYGDSPNIFTTPLTTGLHGLLYSSGKGILWYAPPLIFAVIGFVLFLRRFPRDAVVVLCAGGVNLLFYARLKYWHGDGAWGPRYLLIVLPWLLLPALPVLDRLLAPGRSAVRTVARAGAVVVVLAGITVQSLALAVSFDVPLLTNPNEQARFFSPAQSPIHLEYQVAKHRIAAWRQSRALAANSFVLGSGVYPPEGERLALFPRWTDGNAVVALHPPSGAALHIKLTYFDDRPPAMRTTPTPVTLMIGNETLAPVDRLSIAPANEGFILAY